VDFLALLVVFVKAAALSLGGLGSLPLLREQLVATHLATDEQVVQALAIGRLGTGPNGLYIVSLGYLVGGFTGAIAALVAATIPPLLIVPIAAVSRRWLIFPPVAGLVRGVALATAGLLTATGIGIVTALGAPAWWQVILAALGLVLSLRGTLHPGLVIALGALCGILLAR
jgi:chromate transporter